jgi:hypothetical protein
MYGFHNNHRHAPHTISFIQLPGRVIKPRSRSYLIICQMSIAYWLRSQKLSNEHVIKVKRKT